MILMTLAFLGGVLTILSPCVLPVLPFVFSRADMPFMRSGLPLLVGMAITFAAIASLATVGGNWVVSLNQYGRWAALMVMALFALALLVPRLSQWLSRPFVALGARLFEKVQIQPQPSIGTSMALGVATGLLWVPCAGPILGLVLTGAAIQGANVASALLLLAYAAGAATSLALVLLLSSAVLAKLKRSFGAGAWIRRGIGGAMLSGVIAIGLGYDTTVLAQLSSASTTDLEQRLIDRLLSHSDNSAVAGSDEEFKMPQRGEMAADKDMPILNTVLRLVKSSEKELLLPVERTAPSLDSATHWLNSPALSDKDLRGKVVLIDIWTYTCINCLRTLPYVKDWAQKYRDQGLVVIGVHAPEFPFERDIDNVRKAVQDLGITYPVAVDNDFAIWKAYNNRYWPAFYFVDTNGRVRYHHFGEGQYAKSEQVIQQLLKEMQQTKNEASL